MTHSQTTAEATKEDTEEASAIQLPSNPLVFLQAAQFTLLVVGALYLTRTIVLPVVLAILLKLLMQSGVRRLERIHVPRVAAALLLPAQLVKSRVVKSRVGSIV